MSMTIEQAIRILDPETTVEALAEIEYYNGFSGQTAKVQACSEACEVAVAALRECEEREKTIVALREKWQKAATFICVSCAKCDWETTESGTLIMSLKCGNIIGYPECQEYERKEPWIPVTESMPEERNSVVPGLGTVSKPVLVTWMDPTSEKSYPENSFVREGITRNGEFTISHINGDLVPVAWMHQPKPYELPKEEKA